MTTGAVNAVFLDTNVLVYASVIASPFYQQALPAIRNYAAAGTELWISRQVLREFLAVVTRPQFISPMSAAVAIGQVQYFEAHYRIAEDGSLVTRYLLNLLQHIPIAGRQVHDANIIATMQAHGITHLLTHNTADFARFAHLITVAPLLPT